MKARIKEFGQIIDVVQVETRLETDGPHTYYAEKGTEYGSGHLLWKDTQLDFNICNQSDFDWSSFRREAAKDILAGMVAKKVYHAHPDDDDEDDLKAQHRAAKRAAFTAIVYADELIRQLKQG